MRTKGAAGAAVDRRHVEAAFNINGGWFDVTCVGPDGKVKWKARAKNGVCDTGINTILDVAFRQQTNQTWFIDLIDNLGFSAVAPGDTYSSHAGWAYFTLYSNATRPAWGPTAAAAKSISNTTTADFLITGSGTIFGMALLSNSTHGDSVAGGGKVMWATAGFSGGTQAVANGDTLKITYTVSAS